MSRCLICQVACSFWVVTVVPLGDQLSFVHQYWIWFPYLYSSGVWIVLNYSFHSGDRALFVVLQYVHFGVLYVSYEQVIDVVQVCSGAFMYTGHCEDKMLWKCTTAQQVLTERPHVYQNVAMQRRSLVFVCLCVLSLQLSNYGDHGM